MKTNITNLMDYNILCQEENTRHEKKMKVLLSTLNEIQKNCTHTKTVYNEDPAGGSDHYYWCTHCGKIL